MQHDGIGEPTHVVHELSHQRLQLLGDRNHLNVVDRSKGAGWIHDRYFNAAVAVLLNDCIANGSGQSIGNSRAAAPPLFEIEASGRSRKAAERRKIRQVRSTVPRSKSLISKVAQQRSVN